MALRGKAMDPNAGSWTIDPVFDGSSFKFGYLVRAAEAALQLVVCSQRAKAAVRLHPLWHGAVVHCVAEHLLCMTLPCR